MKNLFNINLFSNVFIPVSYTHLDVYKRQMLYCVLKKKTVQDKIELSKLLLSLITSKLHKWISRLLSST